MLPLEPTNESKTSEVVVAVLGARSGLPDRREEPLADVVPDGARRDAGKVGKFGQRVALLIWHARIVAQCYVTLSNPSGAVPAGQWSPLDA